MSNKLKNYIAGAWHDSASTEFLDITNPATAEVLAKVPLSPPAEVNLAAKAAVDAFDGWRRTPATERIQFLFKLKYLMEEHFDEISRMIVQENGKTMDEARGEMRRAVENVETACGIPYLMQGHMSEDIARGIDELMIRQPVGVAAIIAPFNFPGMIPFWFLPYAVATGNTLIIKPSERCPMTMQFIMDLVEQVNFPKGVINLVNGGPVTVNAILDHPNINAISFVGSTPVARHVYSRGTANGKRVQAQGGAKNPLVLMPDADVEMTTRIVTDSVYGNAGQRCLAAVISPQSKDRIESIIQRSTEEGADILVDGRSVKIKKHEKDHFLSPTILQNVSPDSEAATTEIFGPVMTLIHVETLDDAIKIVNNGEYGNMACIFTNSGAAARSFRYEALAGNIGINIGVAAPMAFFPFSGWKNSFFGTLHGQGRHAVEFYTQTKVVVERWFKDWSRQF